MGQDSELYRLEQFVAKLLARFSELRENNSKLTQELQERDQIIEELRGNLSTKETERGEVSLRLGRILDQIEEWERGMEDTSIAAEETVSEEVDVTAEEEDADEEGEVSDGLAEKTPVKSGEDEGRVQHNLFNMGSSRG